ncbi:hypothetical protein [Streptomyces diastaticus]|uniref:hypothetical protein n=1 Tax=Streptomyces diastaticus TaxID=1956 RepID=UPI003650A21A
MHVYATRNRGARGRTGARFSGGAPGPREPADAAGVLTRHRNHRDAHRIRVTGGCTHVAFALETLHADRDGHLVEAAARELWSLLVPHADGAALQFLSLAGRLVTV